MKLLRPVRDAAELATEWRERARRFSDETLRPLGERTDREQAVPPGVLDGLRAGGFFGLGIPPEWSGSGGDAAAMASVLEEISAGDAAVATMLAVHLSVCAAPILTWGNDGQRRRFLRPLAEGKELGAFALTEPGYGSDAGALACRYARTEGGFTLTGNKMFISNGGTAGVVLAFATRDPAAGHAGISAFIVPKGTPGFSVAQHLPKLGIRGSDTTELVFDRAVLAPELLLGPEGKGFRVAMDALAGGRIGIAACALGVARAAFEEMQRNAKSNPDDTKRAFVARALTDVLAASALVARAAWLKDRGEPFGQAASAAKLFASQAAVRIGERGVDVAATAIPRATARAERLWRDARVFPIVEGTTEIQELILGRELIGR